MKTFTFFTLLGLVTLLGGCELLDPGNLLISEPLILVQSITGLMAIFLVLIEVTWMIRVAKIGWWKVLYGVGILCYALHVSTYYVTVNLVRLNLLEIDNLVIFLTDWSTVLRLHGVGLLLSMEYQRLKDIPKRKESVNDIS